VSRRAVLQKVEVLDCFFFLVTAMLRVSGLSGDSSLVYILLNVQRFLISASRATPMAPRGAQGVSRAERVYWRE